MESLLTPYAARSVPDAAAVLVLAPHPDDEVFGCGGALALHVAAGTRVHVVVLTGGQEAGDAQVRADESRAAARVLGYEPPVFWNLPDRGLLYGEALVQRIVESLAECGATVLYAPSLWENHPDHRALALAALEAARRGESCAIMCYEVSAPLRPNWLIDITPVLEQKRAAIQCFGSQLALQGYDRHIAALNVFRSYTLSSAVQAAEAFEHYDAATLRAGSLPFLDSEYRRQQARELMPQGLMEAPEDLPLVSVLIRSMDRAELRKALDSVAAQTWPRVEVVVVSAKGPGHRPLPEWCGRFPMRLVQSDVPLHRSAAANLAIDQAQGATLLLLDDDDWLDPDHLHKLSTALRARPDAVAAVTGTRGVDPSGQQIHEWKDPALQRLMLVNQMPIMSVLFRRPEAVPAKGSNASNKRSENNRGDERMTPRFDVALDLFEDWDFWLQLLTQGAFVKVAGVSATYLIRTAGGSGVHETQAAQLGQTRLRDKWRGRWPDAWLDALRLDLDNGDHQLRVCAAERDNGLQQLQTLHTASEHAAQQHQTLQAELETLRSERDQVALQLDALRDESAQQLEALRDESAQQLETLRDESAQQLEALRDGSMQQLEVLRAESEQQLDTLRDAHSQQLQALRDAHAQQLNMLRDESAQALQTQQQRYSVLVGENELSLQRVEAQALAHDAMRERHALETFNIRKDKALELAGMQRQSNVVTHALLWARQTIHAQTQQLAQLEQARSASALQVQALLDSRSWRITAPMRNLGAHLRALNDG